MSRKSPNSFAVIVKHCAPAPVTVRPEKSTVCPSASRTPRRAAGAAPVLSTSTGRRTGRVDGTVEVSVQKPAGSRCKKSWSVSSGPKTRKDQHSACSPSSFLFLTGGPAFWFWPGLQLVSGGPPTLGRETFTPLTDSIVDLICKQPHRHPQSNVWQKIRTPCGPVNTTHQTNHQNCWNCSWAGFPAPLLDSLQFSLHIPTSDFFLSYNSHSIWFSHFSVIQSVVFSAFTNVCILYHRRSMVTNHKCNCSQKPPVASHHTRIKCSLLAKVHEALYNPGASFPTSLGSRPRVLLAGSAWSCLGPPPISFWLDNSYPPPSLPTPSLHSCPDQRSAPRIRCPWAPSLTHLSYRLSVSTHWLYFFSVIIHNWEVITYCWL